MQYAHTQRAPLHMILSILGILTFAVAYLSAQMAAHWAVQISLLGTASLMFLLALCFQWLAVRDEGDSLLIRFGPLPLFRRRLPYRDIERVERSRTSILDGWGIHLSPRGGWTWNLWGFDCVDVYFGQGRKIRIGTDDAERLESFLLEQLDRQAS
ncbi:MAG: hypothetical protein RIC55_17050 [Pirellulaceae bacterium]